MLADSGGEIQRIADFLAIPLPTAALPAVCEAVTLDSGCGAERRQQIRGLIRGPARWRRHFLLPGYNGRWRAVLSAEELAQYDEKATNMLTPECRAWLEP